VTQVECSEAECSPKLEWQTLILKNTIKSKQTIK
jgi:hypothetical protein